MFVGRIQSEAYGRIEQHNRVIMFCEVMHLRSSTDYS